MTEPADPAVADAVEYVHATHPDGPACTWSYLGAPCVLNRGHPTPHWLEVEQAMLPDAQEATKLLKQAKSRPDEDE